MTLHYYLKFFFNILNFRVFGLLNGMVSVNDLENIVIG